MNDLVIGIGIVMFAIGIGIVMSGVKSKGRKETAIGNKIANGIRIKGVMNVKRNETTRRNEERSLRRWMS